LYHETPLKDAMGMVFDSAFLINDICISNPISRALRVRVKINLHF
jgi:hypothetical protein